MVRSARRWFATYCPLMLAVILASCATSSTPPAVVGISPTSAAPSARPAPTTIATATLAPTVPAPTAAPIPPTAASLAPATADFSPPTATPALSSQLITADTLANLQPLRTIGYGQAQAAAIGPGNMLLAVGTTAGVAWFALPSLRALRFDAVEGGVDSLAFQYGDQLVVAGPSGQQQLRVATGEPQPPANADDMAWLGGTNPVSSPDGALIATSLGDRQSALWSVADRKLLRNLPGTAPAFSPDGQLIATTLDGRSTLWRVGEDHELLSVAGTQPAFSPDGQALRTGGERDVRLWRLPDGAALGNIDAGEPGWQAEFSADSQELRVLVQTPDGPGTPNQLKVMSVADGHLLRDMMLAESTDGFGGLSSALGPHGTLVAVTGYISKVARAGDGKLIFTNPTDDSTHYQLAAFSADGELAVLITDDGRVSLVSAGDGSVQTLYLESIKGIAISPDGSLLATGTDNPQIWQLIDGALMQTLKLNVNQSWWEGGSRIGAVAFAPDGSTLAVERDEGESAMSLHSVAGWPIASGGAGASTWQIEEEYGPGIPHDIALWRVSSAAHAMAWIDDAGRVTLRASAGVTLTLSEAGGVRALGFSPDGTLLAAGDKAGRVTLFATADGALSPPLEAGGPVADLAFSPDGTLLGARQDDGTLAVWRIGEQTPLVTLKTDAPSKGDGVTPADRFIFSADKQLLITGGTGGVIFYRLSDGQRVDQLNVMAQDMAIGPAGRLLAIAQTDGQVTLWGVP